MLHCDVAHLALVDQFFGYIGFFAIRAFGFLYHTKPIFTIVRCRFWLQVGKPVSPTFYFIFLIKTSALWICVNNSCCNRSPIIKWLDNKVGQTCQYVAARATQGTTPMSNSNFVGCGNRERFDSFVSGFHERQLLSIEVLYWQELIMDNAGEFNYVFSLIYTRYFSLNKRKYC